MSARLFIRDNTNGKVREYGTNRHDALVVINGKLEYHNLQNGDGTLGGSEEEKRGYSFCVPWHNHDTDQFDDAILDIGGDNLANMSCLRCKYLRRPRSKKCRECFRKAEIIDNFTPAKGKRAKWLS